MAETTSLNMEGLLPHNHEQTLAKIGFLAIGGVNKLALISDFDRTLTTGREKDNPTTWGILQGILPDYAQVVDKSFERIYGPRESLLTDKMALMWWHASLGLQVGHETNIQAIQDAIIASGVKPRAGAKQLFDVCNGFGIPRVIVSAGVHDVIDWFAGVHALSTTLTLATKLITDTYGTITGWDESSLIHCNNKKQQSHPEIMDLRENRPNAILLGDDDKDPGIIDGDENVFRVQVLNSDPTKKQTNASIEAGYDAMVVGSLIPIYGLVRYIAGFRSDLQAVSQEAQ